MALTLKSAMGRFGAAAKAKLANIAAVGEPEEQLRAPLESLLWDMAELCSLPRGIVACVGESALSDLKTRPDYAVTVRNTLVGFIEVKAPGKGADPRRYKGHDNEQWEKLQSLPNLMYTDGNEFSLWQDDKLVALILLDGDIEKSGSQLDAPPELVKLFDDFLKWDPQPPRDVKQLARQSARLCRFLRDEVSEQLEAGSKALTTLAAGWRKMLFPEATNAQFADGYAQAVTFGLLVARVTCPTDGGRGASLLHWAAIDTKGSGYGRKGYTTETVHGGVQAAGRQAHRRGRHPLSRGFPATGRQ